MPLGVIAEVTVATVPGESLDASNAKQFKQSITPVLTANAKVVVDLHRLWLNRAG